MDEVSILRERIRHAFSGLAKPLPSELPRCSCEECAYIGDTFRDVDPFDANKDSLLTFEYLGIGSEMSATGLRYFLPIWLLDALANPCSDSAYALADTTKFSLPSSNQQTEVPYSDAQREAVAQVLRFVAEHHPSPDGDEFVQAAEWWRS